MGRECQAAAAAAQGPASHAPLCTAPLSPSCSAPRSHAAELGPTCAMRVCTATTSAVLASSKPAACAAWYTVLSSACHCR